MKKIISSALLSAIAAAMWAIGAAAPALAVTLSLRPSGNFEPSALPYQLTLGSEFQVDLIASDLGESSFPFVSAFDSNILYDSKYLQLNNVSFGHELNLGAEENSVKQVTKRDLPYSTYYSRFVRISESSLLASDLIRNNQSSAFTLATLTFNAIGMVGSSSQMTLVNNSITGLDASGNHLRLDVPNPNLAFQIEPKRTAPVSVPESAPNGWVYLALAGGAAGLKLRKKTSFISL